MAPTLCQKWFLKIVFLFCFLFLFCLFVLFLFCFVFVFVEKLNISCSLDHTILFKFHLHVVQAFFKDVWRDFKLLMLALATVALKSFNAKFTPEVDFPIRYFMLPLLILTLKVYSLSIHYLISIWTTSW